MDGRTYWRSSAASPGARSRNAHLLPAYDEYLVGYRHRDALLATKHAKRVNAGGGILAPSVLFRGRVIGSWRRTIARGSMTIEIDPFGRLTADERKAIANAARRYAAFLAGTGLGTLTYRAGSKSSIGLPSGSSN